MAEDARLLLDLLDDSDELAALVMMMDEDVRKAASNTLSTTSFLSAVQNAMLRGDALKPRNIKKEEEKRQRKTLIPPKPRRFKYKELHKRSRALQDLSDSEFFKYLHVTKRSYAFIISQLEPLVPAPSIHSGHCTIDACCILTLGLRYLSSRTVYKNISRELCTSQSTVYLHMMALVNYLCDLAPKFICWPRAERVAEVEGGFQYIAGLSGVMGALGNCHIPTKYPSLEAALYHNRELQSATVQLLAVCDHRSSFTYVHAGHPGAAQEQKVLECTSLYQGMGDQPLALFPSTDHHIVGGPAFSPSEHLLVPFRKDDGLQEEEQPSKKENELNQQLLQTQTPITKAFQLLKARFQRLQFIDMDVRRIPNLMKACCVLHNITLRFPEEEDALAQLGS